ncbi:MAG: M55 family metallopeptidase [Thermoproteota archaeon]
MAKVFVSVDLEGMPFVVSREQLSTSGRLFNEAREISTRIVAAFASKLVELGYEVVVADSHGQMVTLDPLRLPRGVRVVRGYPRPTSMVSHAKGSEFAAFLGYHARAGESSVFSHTYSGLSFYRVVVNGVEASEFYLNSLLLGEWGVPIGLVAGSAELLRDVEYHAPWAVRVPLKESAGYYSAVSPSLAELEEAVAKGAEEAARRARSGALRPLEPRRPVTVAIEFASPAYAEVFSAVPGAELVDGRTVKLTVDTMEAAYRLLELAAVASAGVRLLTQPR